MEPRKDLQELNRVAEEFMSEGEYQAAFYEYKVILDEQPNPELTLICKCRMLACQYHVLALNWNVILPRAKALISEIDQVIFNENTTADTNSFLELKKELLKVITMLDSGNVLPITSPKIKFYFRAFAEKMIDRFNGNEVDGNLQMLEIDSSNPTYDIDYLQALYTDLRMISGKKGNKDLFPQLLVCIAQAHLDYAARIDDVEKQKSLNQMAINYFRSAQSKYRCLTSPNGERLYLSILDCLQEMYNLEVNPAIAATTLSVMHAMLACEGFANLLSSEENEEQKEKLGDEIQDRHDWFDAVLRELTRDQTDFVNCLRESARHSKVVAQPWQDVLDRLIIGPPTKKRRLGQDIYAKLHAKAAADWAAIEAKEANTATSTASNTTPPMVTTNTFDETLEDYPTPYMGQ